MSFKHQKRIVIATDVRFWQRGTGAHQRIFSMVDHLQQKGHQVTTLFCGTLAEVANSKASQERERERIQQCGSTVLSVFDDWTPVGFFNKAIWQFQCTANWLLKGTSQSKNGKGNVASSINNPNVAAISRTLSDYPSPLLHRRFHEMLGRLEPDVVLMQYVTMAWLVPEQRQATKPQWWLDTHDHLSERARQFEQFGHPHWLDISSEQETEAMAKFDTVIAIQGDEAKAFRASLSEFADGRKTRVIVAGHPRPAATEQLSSKTVTPGKVFSLGYFGSDNASNVDAVEWFLADVWPSVVAVQPTATLLLAGSVCNSFPDVSEQTGLVTREHVDEVAELYRSFQVAINPVRFGTGLKIKNQEALAFGKPLVVTDQGATGMVLPEKENGDSPILIADDAASFVNHVVELLQDEDRLEQLSQSAQQYAEQYLSPDFVYSELCESLVVTPT